MTTTSNTVIVPRDFSASTRDVNRDTWTVATVRYVVDALAGQPVAITTDKITGHTIIGARLVDVFDGGPGRGPRVAVETTLSDGKTQTTNYYLPEVGMILPLGQWSDNVKWKALDAHRRDTGAAIEQARAAHPECTYGKWEASPTSYRGVMHVTFTPQREDGGPRWYGTVALPDPATT